MSDTHKQNDPGDSDRIEEKNEDDFVVVGLGASAGGIKAFKEFFTRVKPDSGMAYVVILHLSPKHESNLAEILQLSSQIPVTQVNEPAKIEPNRVYVIPPNKSLAMKDGFLTLSEIKHIGERRAPVDIFFRTLAETRESRAVCVIMSGTGANGSMGLKRIKEFGGLVLVQDPKEADYDDMPRNAIATGFVDQVLSVAELPERIAAYDKHLTTIRIPKLMKQSEKEEEALRDIFAQIKRLTGHDFSDYKRATVLRRIKRRIVVRSLPDIISYSRFIRKDAVETRALLKDLLISVTHFFRDHKAFEALEKNIIPRLFQGKQSGDNVRVWVVGCATGEEAYSVAMLLAEFASNSINVPDVQIFATDIDEEAITIARNGFYTATEVADVPKERLRRFFVKEATGYRVRKELREITLFASHNIIKDPPFSRLDFVCCRNLLIYLNRIAQDRVLDVLHFALRPGGYLFLGTSESVNGATNLFHTADKDHHIYQSRSVATRLSLSLPDFSPATLVSGKKKEEQAEESRKFERLSYADLHHRLLEGYAPPSIVLNEEYDVIHLSENAGQYLKITGGEPSYNILKIVHTDLLPELRAALYQATQKRTNVEVHNILLRIEDRSKSINLHVRPVLDDYVSARGFILVLFEEVSEASEDRTPSPAHVISDMEPVTRHLEEELARVRSQLRLTVDQYETQTEELKASNEELQAMNEELRSTAEELETSREELQSVNEELTTVNQELKIKIEELSQANNDLHNLMDSTEIGTIFLDRSMRVKLFTPQACDISNLIQSDLGRPLLDITSKLIYEDLHDDVEQVLDRLQTLEREVQTQEDKWYLMRLSPYRTAQHRIDGVILTFTEITGRKQAEKHLQSSEERLRLLIESAKDYAIFSLTEDNRIETWNAGAERLFGYKESEIKGQSGEILFTPEDRERGLSEERIRRAREEGGIEDERWLIRKDGTRFYAGGGIWPFHGSQLSGFVKIARDLTEQKRHHEELLRACDKLEIKVKERTIEIEEANKSLQAEVNERRAAEERVRGLMQQLVTAQEDERRRIARDLHDQLGQKLTALRLNLDFLNELCGNIPELVKEFDKVRLMIKSLDDEVTFLAWELRPAALDDLGLVSALRNYIEEWSKQFNISAEFQTNGLEKYRLLPEIETNLYRIAQESLNNIYKHAEATKVGMILEQRDDEVTLIIEDNGKGFDPAEMTSSDEDGRGFGLMGMRERASLSNGTLEVESTPGNGTTLFARIPISFVEKEGPEE